MTIKRKRLLFVFVLLIFVLSACATHNASIRNNPDQLSPGIKPRTFLKAWGEPDESFYYYDFLNTHSLRYPGKLDPQTGTGSVSGHGQRADYTHETVVWIYKKQKKILFFEKGYLVYDTPGALSLVWRLVGWENIVESPEKDSQRKKTYTMTYGDGSKYIGHILNGKRHGQGTYTWPGGEKYVGEWVNNRAIGGWYYKTAGHRVWVYEDSAGKWIIKK
jgi:hypothetical protein